MMQIIEKVIIGIIDFIFGILEWIFNLFPSIPLPIEWVPRAKGLIQWGSYFFPLDTLYLQFKIVAFFLSIYLTIRIINFLRSN